MIKHIHQVLPSFSKWDAVGTDTFLMRNTIRDFGFESEIYYEMSGDPENSSPLEKLNPYLNRQDTALIFHFSIGSDFPGRFVQYSNRKIIRYHNITPPEFFSAPAEGHIRTECARGRQQIPMLSVFCNLVMADSRYNGNEFTAYTPIPTEVVPIFRDYDRLGMLPSDSSLENAIQNSGRPSVLFVGRICPNKAQHDLLKLMALYKRVFQEPLTLILIGGFFSPAFQREIEDYAAYLKLTMTNDVNQMGKHDVVIAGSVGDEQLATFYKNSTIFCSLSDHEGFGVPLVEAMRFRLPILAHKAAAVPETVADAACLVDKSDWVTTLAALRNMVTDKDLRAKLTERGWARSNQLSIDAARAALKAAFMRHGILC